MIFFLSETAYDFQTDSWSSWCVATEFLPLVNRATVQRRSSPTGLTHLGLTAHGEVHKTQHCSSSPHGPVRFLSSIKHYSPPFYSSGPSHNSSNSWSPKKDAEMPNNGAHILFFCFADFFFSISNLKPRWIVCSITDVNFFGTRSFLTTTSLSFQSSHQSDLCVICGWSQDEGSLGTSHYWGIRVTEISRIQWYVNIPAYSPLRTTWRPWPVNVKCFPCFPFGGVDCFWALWF